jgi:hypothetical protein
MGYTHYWGKQGDVDEASYAAALKDIAKIVTSEKAILANGSGDEGSKPKVTGGISFNGIGDASHETFALPPKAKMLDNDFCKTNQKPYDVVVVAALSRLAEVAGIKIGSDGDAEDLKDGVALASKVLGRQVANPKGAKAKEPSQPKSKPALRLVKSALAKKYNIQEITAAEFNAQRTSEAMIKKISKALNANAAKWIDVFFEGKDGVHGEVQFAMGEALTIVKSVIDDYKVERLDKTPMVNLGLTKKD